MAAALAKVKRELGRSAVIMNTRTVKQGGWFGLGRRTFIEITATDQSDVLPKARSSDSMVTWSRRTAEAVRTETVPPAPVATPVTPVTLPVTPDFTPAPVHEAAASPVMEKELLEIKTMVQGLVGQSRRDQVSSLPTEWRQIYVRLIQNQVAEEIAQELLQQLMSRAATGQTLDNAAVQELLIQQVAQMLTPGCPITLNRAATGRSKVVALVGPTGVGKTTTVAKLAAHFRLKEGRKVGLITIDTYRIAAVDQLRTYARIIDVPLEVALTPEELRQALRKLADRDIVFIDTAGRSQFDELKLNELRHFIEAAQPDETHLVVSSNCSPAVLTRALAQFSKVGVNRVIFSKLDEAVGIGTLLSVLKRVEAKLSYVTTGQDVPDDIEVGDQLRLARMIVEGSGFDLAMVSN
ncbi:MAG: Flagellar biosynthesis protein FlhF [Phycisphaerae bacterium]|nr:Flagellar biosynthesis protein FlhF [Phycisphaerae bacterium]